MLDLTWTTQCFVSPPPAQRRVMVLVDHASADVRLLDQVAPIAGQPPASLVWLWVVTPGSIVSWGALMADSGDCTRFMLAALSERIEEARRCLTPLQHACVRANIPCQIHIRHGAVTENVIRLVCNEAVEQLLLPSMGGSIYGHSPQELAMILTQRLTVPVGILEEPKAQAH